MKTRDELGKQVRDIWIEWAREQLNPKPSWFVPWESLSEPDKEVDRRIGERLFKAGMLEAAELDDGEDNFSSAGKSPYVSRETILAAANNLKKEGM